MKYKDIPVWSIILSFFFSFASCRDEMAGKGGVLEVEEGIPGTLTLSVTSGNPALHVVTPVSYTHLKMIRVTRNPKKIPIPRSASSCRR